MRQDAQKQSQKFCRSKEDKNGETHPEKPEKGETGCVPGAGEGCGRYGRVGKPEIRTKMHQIAMQHMKKGNRRNPSVFAGFLAGAEGLEPSARGFGVDVGERTRERVRTGVARFSRTSPKRVVLVWCCERLWQQFFKFFTHSASFENPTPLLGGFCCWKAPGGTHSGPRG